MSLQNITKNVRIVKYLLSDSWNHTKIYCEEIEMNSDRSARNCNWYAFVTQVNKERLAVEQLQAQSFDIFLPQHLKTVSHARKRITKPAALFPGYGFVRLNRKLDSWRKINGTRGVKYLISNRDRPVPVPDEVITSLKCLQNEFGLISFGSLFAPNDNVRFVAGPFLGLIGRLSKVDQKGRVEILLQLLNSEVHVKTDAYNLQPV